MKKNEFSAIHNCGLQGKEFFPNPARQLHFAGLFIHNVIIFS